MPKARAALTPEPEPYYDNLLLLFIPPRLPDNAEVLYEEDEPVLAAFP